VIHLIGNSKIDKKYINMDQFGANWFFYIEDMMVSNEDMKNIKPLSIEYSSLLWNQSINNHKRHFTLFSKDERQALLLKKIDYDWQADWNNDEYENFSDYLKGNIIYKPYDIIVVFWSKECAAETSWEIFLKHWANFLFDDEGVILLNTTNGNMLVFCSDGILYKGKPLVKL
jgi:hypothetical protein